MTRGFTPPHGSPPLECGEEEESPKPRALARGAGFTLVELVIAICLSAILGIPAGVLISEQLRAALTARDQVVAIGLARAELERLESLNDFFAITTQAPAAVPGFAAYTRAVTVTCEAGNCTNTNFDSQGIKQIDVTVTKTGIAGSLASLTTYRAKHVSYGQ